MIGAANGDGCQREERASAKLSGAFTNTQREFYHRNLFASSSSRLFGISRANSEKKILQKFPDGEKKKKRIFHHFSYSEFRTAARLSATARCNEVLATAASQSHLFSKHTLMFTLFCSPPCEIQGISSAMLHTYALEVCKRDVCQRGIGGSSGLKLIT